MRPSDERRKALADGIRLPAVSNFFPIQRYYDAADLLYDSIQATKNDTTRLDLCYVYGKRYCRFVLESIPTHNYYGLPGNRLDQKKHTEQVGIVLDIIEHIAQQMDMEEVERQKAIEQENERRIKEWEIYHWQERQHKQQQQKSDIEASAMEKLKKLQEGNMSNDVDVMNAEPIIAVGIPVMPPPPSHQNSTTRFRLEDSDEDDECNTTVYPNGTSSFVLPPPMQPLQPPPALPQPPDKPPSYEAVVGKYHPLKVSQPLLPIDTNKLPHQSLSQIRAQHSKLYKEYTSTGRIRVSSLNTYQGRRTASTNGCTVISALCAAVHLNSKPNITNDTIERIIDEVCGPLLRTIRTKLGLGGHALIIPSDVHDHLVDEKILHQEKFRGAAGGNVLDMAHYSEFIKLLTDGTSKAAATFFFREHVISIVKCVDFTTKAISYDWIDSLSSPVTGRATRTMCADATSLQTQLLQYVTGKLSDAACNTPWDDGMADLDPRVFQGFVWGDPESSK